MSVSLKNYTLRQVALAFLPIMVVWLVVIYIFILEEVYDNVDDGLKDRKKEIIALSKEYPERILSVSEYGIGQFLLRARYLRRIVSTMSFFTNPQVMKRSYTEC